MIMFAYVAKLGSLVTPFSLPVVGGALYLCKDALRGYTDNLAVHYNGNLTDQCAQRLHC